MKRRPTYALRRVGQTATRFDNGVEILAKLALHRLTGSPTEVTYRLPSGTQIVCPNVAGARLPIYELFIDDTYNLGWFAQGMRDEPTIIDIGAHIGSFSLAITQRKPRATVKAYEASATTASYLRRNVVANGLENRIEINNVAVAGASGTVQFIDNGAGSVHNGMVSPESAVPITVPSTAFTDIAAQVEGPIDLIKMDAEGAEYDFILASKPVDWACVERVVMEYHNVTGHHWEELEQFFASTPLRVVRRIEHSPRLGMVWLSREPDL